MKTIILLITLRMLSPPDVSEVMEVIKEVETNNRHDVIGDGGKAFGVLQIHRAVVLDVNRFYSTNYRHEEMWQENCAEEVFYLYQGLGIWLYLKKHNKYPTEEIIVRWWNGGIYKGHLYKSTEEYYERYLDIKNQK